MIDDRRSRTKVSVLPNGRLCRLPVRSSTGPVIGVLALDLMRNLSLMLRQRAPLAPGYLSNFKIAHRTTQLYEIKSWYTV
jgi:hypothetical protein